MDIQIKKKYVIKLTEEEREDLVLALNNTFSLIDDLSNQKQFPPNVLQNLKELLDL